MICRQALHTKSKLKGWGMLDDDSCVLYGLQGETVAHLFFSCAFSKLIWEKILHMVSIYRGVGAIDQEIGWLLNHLPSKCFKSFIVKVLFSTAAYNIWIDRNNRVFKGRRQTHSQVIQSILSEISAAFVSWRNVKRTFVN
uniref:Reverse transcriptase zinc-binding domain-containing protein n=1 Tax=Davidia involucrata TaxID=16924 RepID=A0A5B6YJ99_DAVIN